MSAPTPQATGPVPSLDTRLAGVEQALVRLSTERGYEARPDRAAGTAEDRGAAITVVVTGETSRGKSTLLNLLLDRPDLLPTEADVTTNVHVVIRHGRDERARILLASGAEIEASVADLASWATVAGNPGNGKGVRAVELRLDHPLLARGLVLVDTPGVGGIEAAHGEVTLLALRTADALLFVKDAGAPISGPEGAFLSKAAERIETVILCLTKTDLYPGWQTVAAQDRDFLGRHLPRFREAPIIPVSALHGRRALARAAAGNTEAAARARATSGLDTLAAAIETRVIQPGLTLRLRNRARGVLSTVDELERQANARLSATLGDTTQQTELAEAQARIQLYRRDTASWNGQLGDDLQRLRLTLLQDMNREFLGIKVDLQANRINRPDELERLPGELSRRMDDLVVRLNARLADGVTAIIRGLSERFSLDGIDIRPAGIDLDMLPNLADSPTAAETGAEKVAGLTRSLMSVSGPVTTLRVFGTTDPFVLALGLAAGVALAVVERARGGRVKDLGDARARWSATLAEATGTASVEIPPQLEMRFLDIRSTIVAEVKAAIDRRILALGREEKVLRDLAAAQQAVRDKAAEQAKGDLARLAEHRTRAERLLGEAALGSALATGRRPATAGSTATEPSP